MDVLIKLVAITCDGDESLESDSKQDLERDADEDLEREGEVSAT
jgi:hypothetical protein